MQKFSLQKMKYIAKRSCAFLLDYIFFITFYGVIMSFYPALLPNFLDDTSAFIFISSVLLLLLFFLVKDSILGISIGKWCMGLMIRDASYPDTIPSFWILFIRNFLALTAYPFEFIKIIFDENNQRFGDKIFVTIVIDNPDKAELKFRTLTALFILVYFFFNFSGVFFQF